MRQLLIPDSYYTDITALTMSDMHFCRPGNEIIGEPEGHLSKVEVRNSSHILSRDREAGSPGSSCRFATKIRQRVS
jgi:hypothetical protein